MRCEDTAKTTRANRRIDSRRVEAEHFRRKGVRTKRQGRRAVHLVSRLDRSIARVRFERQLDGRVAEIDTARNFGELLNSANLDEMLNPVPGRCRNRDQLDVVIVISTKPQASLLVVSAHR